MLGFSSCAIHLDKCKHITGTGSAVDERLNRAVEAVRSGDGAAGRVGRRIAAAAAAAGKIGQGLDAAARADRSAGGGFVFHEIGLHAELQLLQLFHKQPAIDQIDWWCPVPRGFSPSLEREASSADDDSLIRTPNHGASEITNYIRADVALVPLTLKQDVEDIEAAGNNGNEQKLRNSQSSRRRRSRSAAGRPSPTRPR